jgi:BON domain
MGLAPWAVTVTVSEGQVSLTGTVEPEVRKVIPVIERLCRSVDGVVSVRQRLSHPEADAEAASPLRTRVRARRRS